MKTSVLELVAAVLIAGTGEAIDTAKWMKSIRNDVLLKDIIIPGTHDSCAIHTIDLAQTQWSSITEQLQRGIRYLDMRVGPCESDKNKLCMFHGPIDLDMKFDKAEDEIYEFLRVNPSESVFMRLGYERDGGINICGTKACGKLLKDFQGFVEDNYLTKRSRWFQHGKLAMEDIHMKDVRGKIVIFWDSGAKTSKWGYDYKNVDTRDGWEFDDADELFKTFKERAEKATSVSGWFENPTSGVLSSITFTNPWSRKPFRQLKVPKKDADEVNPKVQGYLNSNPKTKGIISMDVPHDDMIKKMLELNGPFYKK